MVNQALWVYSGQAVWYLFHPDDLAHRQDAPIDWMTYPFAIRREFMAGSLIAISTGATSEWFVRFTDEGLTELERSHLAGSIDFRLQVRHQRLCLDGGDVLPFSESLTQQSIQENDDEENIDEYGDEIDDEDWNEDPDDDGDYGFISSEQPSWLEIPNGLYRATVHTFDWSDGSLDAELPSYTVVFTPVDDLEAIAPPHDIPRLIEGEGLIEVPKTDENALPSLSIPPTARYALLDWQEILFPGLNMNLPLTQEQYRQVEQISDYYLKSHIHERYLIIGHHLFAGRIGMLFQESGFGHSYDDCFLSGRGMGWVRLVSVEEKKGIRLAGVEPFELPSAFVAPEVVESLKQAFGCYATSRPEYQQHVPHPAFMAEQIQSLTHPRIVAWAIANTLSLSPAKQYELLQLSDFDLVTQLMMILEGYG